MNPIQPLGLADLEQGCPALTPAAGLFLAEAATVCLDNQGHSTTLVLDVTRDFTSTYQVDCLPCSNQMRRAYNDMEATEYGACALAIVIVRALTKFTVIERARKGGGFDYWLGDETEKPFQRKARLEVSGILNGNASTINARISQNWSRQANLMGFTIVVVEFSAPTAKVVTK